MRYIVVDEPRNGVGDFFHQEFDNKSDAIKKAVLDVSYLTSREKKHRRIYVLESVNSDEEAENHFDGDVIWEEYEN
jgi:hypothetical protein